MRRVKATPQPSEETPAWCRQLPRPECSRLERIPLPKSWFEVYRVASGVFAIYEPHQSEETISYLILGKQTSLLFDTSMGIGDLKSLTQKLTKLPIIVLNSHTHDDHVGNDWQFDTIYGMDTNFTQQDARGSNEDAQAENAPGETCGALPSEFDPAKYGALPWKVSRWIHDGDRIDLGGRSLQIIATPGHTPDAISLFDPANGLLFTGDTYYPGTIWIYRPETDFAAYANSVQKIAAMQAQVKLVLGAHNVPVAPPSVLGDLATAYRKVQTGQVQPRPAGSGKVIYQIGDISFLMRAAPDRH